MKITNSHFGNGGCSDGVQIVGDAYGVQIGPGNEFSGIRQGTCAAHVDSIQLYGSSHTQIVGNYFHDDDTIIMAPDGGDSEVIADNVMVGGGYVPAVQLGSHDGTQFVHNTVMSIDVHMDAQDRRVAELQRRGARQHRSSTARSNAPGANCSGCTVAYNLFNSSGAASGTNATVGDTRLRRRRQPDQLRRLRAGRRIAGVADASDGVDLGARVSGSARHRRRRPTPRRPRRRSRRGPTGTTNDSTPTFAFTSSEADSVFECRVDSGSWVDCASPWTTPALSDGAALGRRPRDGCGGQHRRDARDAVVHGRHGAAAGHHARPRRRSRRARRARRMTPRPTFAFTSSEADSVFECRVDSGSWVDCASPWTTPALSNGPHSVSVRATDVAGNTDTTPATGSFTVATAPPPDTTAPETTISSGPTGTTSDSTPTFAFGSSEPGSTYECRVDSGAWASCTSPWTTAALSDGPHGVSVRATDAADNTDASPATRSFTVAAGPPPDTTAPTTTITSGPSATTSATDASFAFTSSETGSTFECKLDSAAFAACTSPKAYSDLSAGAHAFSVRAIDAAGNTDATPATQSWTIQGAPPADDQPDAAFTYSPAAPAIGQAVAFDASSATCDDTPCTYTWVDDGPDGPAGTQWPLGEGKTMTFTFQGEGVKYVRVDVTDADGDADSTMKPITVASGPAADTTAPDTTISSGPAGTTSNSTPTFAFSSSEEASAFECRVDAAAWVDCTTPWTTAALSEGPHSVSVRATDAAGNTDATPATRAFTVTAAPASDITPPDTTISSGPDGATNDSTPTFDFAATEPGSAFACQVDLGATAACASPWTTPVLPDGSHRVAVGATDAAGNADASPATRSFRVDTQAPDTTIESAPPAYSDDTSATLTFDADEPGASFECRLDWRSWADCTSPKTYSGLSVGRHSAHVRATDAAGNVDASPDRAWWRTVTP